jgi:predicted O-methyltransferase YrrM
MRGGLSGAECEVLAEWATRATGAHALEVGHYTGLSTSVLLDSLPRGVTLWTVDHHLGDDLCHPTSVREFQENIEPFLGRVFLELIVEDLRHAHEKVPAGEVGFVFYDAGHDRQTVCEFWELYRDKFGARCILVFDDADWAGMRSLRSAAAYDGFICAESRVSARCMGDKRNIDTYALEIMTREVGGAT